MPDPQSLSTDQINDTIREMLGKPLQVEPQSLQNLIACMAMLPMSYYMYYDKIVGLFVVSNLDPDSWEGQSLFAGPNFIVYDFTLESALARAVHYYYHTKFRS